MARKTKDNLLDLENLSDESICQLLHDLFQAGQHQINFGDDHLIWMNPSKETLDSSKKTGTPFMNKLVQKIHLKTMKYRSFCIIPMGVSGSGKSYLCQSLMDAVAELPCMKDKVLIKKLTMVRTVLGAFTNAEMNAHADSTRCVNVFQLFFDEAGSCSGLKVNNFLLESLRLTALKAGEKSFHIFYYYFSGVEKQRLNTNFIKDSNSHRISRVNILQDFSTSEKEYFYKDHWKETFQCMGSLGISSNDADGIVDVLTSIILLRDLRFIQNIQYSGVSMENEKTFQIVCKLLCMDSDEFEKFFLTTETIEKGEKIRHLRNPDDAALACDAAVRYLYEHLFAWVVFKMNSSVCPKTSRSEASRMVLMDAFGVDFNSKSDNALERLLINSFNEKLSWHLDRVVVKHLSDKDAFPFDGQKKNDPPDNDNNNDDLVRLLIEPGIMFDIIGEVTSTTRLSNLELLQKITQQLENNRAFQRCPENRLQFIINHSIFPVGRFKYSFTGHFNRFKFQITYSIHGFMEKNRLKSFESDLTSHFKESRSLFLVNLVQYKHGERKQSTSTEKKEQLKGMALKFKKPNHVTTESETFLTDDFKSQLKTIFEGLNMATLFIMCIKPTFGGSQDLFDKLAVNQQLNFLKIPKIANRYKKAFFISTDAVKFLKKYKFISFGLFSNVEINFGNCLKVFMASGAEDYVFGKNKIFLKYACIKKLNEVLWLKENQVTKCQAHIRRYLSAKNYDLMIKENNANQQLKSFFQMITIECLESFQKIESNFWLKMIFLEHTSIITKCYVKSHKIVINNTTASYDGTILGMNNENFLWHTKNFFDVVGGLKEGLTLTRDKEGNIFARKSSSCPTISIHSRVGNEPREKNTTTITETDIKVFDVDWCRKIITKKIEKVPIKLDELILYCTACIHFKSLTTDSEICLFLINFFALDMLGSTKTLKQLELSRKYMKEEEFYQWKKILTEVKRSKTEHRPVVPPRPPSKQVT